MGTEKDKGSFTHGYIVYEDGDVDEVIWAVDGDGSRQVLFRDGADYHTYCESELTGQLFDTYPTEEQIKGVLIAFAKEDVESVREEIEHFRGLVKEEKKRYVGRMQDLAEKINELEDRVKEAQERLDKLTEGKE